MTDAARRLLLVHAHPDDETLTTGGTIARYVAEGAEVTVLTCTLGEEGEVIGEVEGPSGIDGELWGVAFAEQPADEHVAPAFGAAAEFVDDHDLEMEQKTVLELDDRRVVRERAHADPPSGRVKRKCDPVHPRSRGHGHDSQGRDAAQSRWSR